MASGALDVETIQVGGSTLRKQKKNSREFPGIRNSVNKNHKIDHDDDDVKYFFPGALNLKSWPPKKVWTPTLGSLELGHLGVFGLTLLISIC